MKLCGNVCSPLPQKSRQLGALIRVEKAWGGVVAALKHVQVALRSWSRNTFGSVTTELEELRVKLEEAKSGPLCTCAACPICVGLLIVWMNYCIERR